MKYLIYLRETYFNDPGISPDDKVDFALAAEATMVQVILKKQNGNLLLMVQDNGRGIMAGQSARANSFGLAGIQERVRSFGGESTITGVPGKVTVITVSIPAGYHS